jgi:hypothetical protein
MRKVVFAILVALVFAVPSFSVTYKIDFILGDVIVMKGKKSITPDIGYVIKKGDKVITGKDSECSITIDDKGVLKLEEKSSVSFDEIGRIVNDYKLDKVSAKGNIIFSAKGAFSDKNRLGIKTETAFATVRGTEFDIETDGDSTTLYTLEGTVYIAPLIPGVRYGELIDNSIEVNENEKITITSLDVINATSVFNEKGEFSFLESNKKSLTEAEKERFNKRLKMLKELQKQRKSELQEKTKEYSKDPSKLFDE